MGEALQFQDDIRDFGNPGKVPAAVWDILHLALFKPASSQGPKQSGGLIVAHAFGAFEKSREGFEADYFRSMPNHGFAVFNPQIVKVVSVVMLIEVAAQILFWIKLINSLWIGNFIDIGNDNQIVLPGVMQAIDDKIALVMLLYAETLI